ncbi:hypothetical protein ACIOD2_47555 [Amycolatopsis sp. NPDC088138]|uniref:hypothetical protein n=1 Tax=Amycolatopsis sp. NPDC088138 TaxID=3363938 RepID=UPI00381304B4
MRTWITDIARDLLADPPPGGRVTLEEIAACAGIKNHHLRAFYSSVSAITNDLVSGPTEPTHSGRC